MKFKIQHKVNLKQFLLEWFQGGTKCGVRLEDVEYVIITGTGSIFIDGRWKCKADTDKLILLNLDLLELNHCYDLFIEQVTDDSRDFKLWVEWKPSQVKKCKELMIEEAIDNE